MDTMDTICPFILDEDDSGGCSHLCIHGDSDASISTEDEIRASEGKSIHPAEEQGKTEARATERECGRGDDERVLFARPSSNPGSGAFLRTKADQDCAPASKALH
jgi:hypothetical protein